MYTPPRTPTDEGPRQEELRRYDILDTEDDPEMDALTALAAQILKVPIVLVSIVDADRQWFKSRFGLAVRETSREVSFCGHVVAEDQPLVVRDAVCDPRFASNPLVTGDPRIRFYAGMPLRTSAGFVLGTLCAIAHEPREISADERQLLETLARQVMARLELRRRNLELQRLEAESALLKSQVELVLNSVPAVIGYWDSKLECRFANHGYLEWFGVRPEDMRGRHIRSVIGEHLYELNRPHIEGALRGEGQCFERTIVDPTGKVRYTQAAYVPDAIDRNVRGFFVLITDITSRRQMEEELFEEREKARITLGSIAEGVITADAQRRIQFLNPAAERMTGWSQAEALGKPMESVLPFRPFDDDGTGGSEGGDGQGGATFKRELSKLTAEQGSQPGVMVRRDGSESAVEVHETPLTDGQGATVGVVVVSRDVSEVLLLARRMSHLAHHDALTGLPNRLLLQDRMNHAIETARRNSTSFAVLFLDLDKFKQVNDSWGHAFADRLLVAIGERLVATLRACDTVCRQGGDEFVLLLEGVTDASSVKRIAEKLMRRMAVPFVINGTSVVAAFSIGASIYPDDGADVERLFKCADAAMFRAKEAGRNCFRLSLRGGEATESTSVSHTSPRGEM